MQNKITDMLGVIKRAACYRPRKRQWSTSTSSRLRFSTGRRRPLPFSTGRCRPLPFSTGRRRPAFFNLPFSNGRRRPDFFNLPFSNGRRPGQRSMLSTLSTSVSQPFSSRPIGLPNFCVLFH